MPSDIGRNLLLPWLDEFQQLHPNVLLQLRVSDQVADLFTEHLDASIRYGQLADSSLVALALAPSNRRTVCASPGYIARHGLPKTPAEDQPPKFFDAKSQFTRFHHDSTNLARALR